MKKLALPILLLFAMGCWSSNGDQPATARPNAAPKDSYKSQAMWEWPARSGKPRDLATDHAACLQKSDAQTTAMMKVGVLWDCMRRKGWHRIKEQYRFDAAALAAPWIWADKAKEKPDLATDERACNEPPAVKDAPPAELDRFFACMAGKGWKRNEQVWKKRLSSSQ
jgi:hypothetical protein